MVGAGKFSVYMLCFIHLDQKVRDTCITVGHAFKMKHIFKIMYFNGFSIFSEESSEFLRQVWNCFNYLHILALREHVLKIACW